jgi:hypothetical protein
MTRIDVERIGGFGGFGIPGSRLRSRGSVDAGHLSLVDARALEALFDAPPSEATPLADAFRYRLTRHTSAGPQTVEVAEARVPAAVKAVLRDELI